MKILGVIPARFASTRFPGKPLALLKGKPLLQWVVELALKSKSLSEIVVATDHDEIAELCRRLNVPVVMTAPDCATGTDRVFQAVQHLARHGASFGAVINIQGDEPLLPVEYIDLLARAMTGLGAAGIGAAGIGAAGIGAANGSDKVTCDMATLAHPLEEADLENPNAVKVLINQMNEAIYFSRFPIPFSREKFILPQNDLRFPVQKHIGLYGFTIPFLNQFCRAPQSFIEKAESLEQLRALDLGAKIKVMSVSKPTYGVDTPEDLQKLERRL